MPVPQVVPHIQPDFSVANMVQRLGQIAGDTAGKIMEIKKQSNYNEVLHGQALESLAEIKKETGMSDDMFSKISKAVDLKDIADPGYEKRAANIVGNLYFWSQMKQQAGADIPMPDYNMPLQQNLPFLQSAASKAVENKKRSIITGGAGGQPATPDIWGVGDVGEVSGPSGPSTIAGSMGGEQTAVAPASVSGSQALETNSRISMIPTMEGREAASRLMEDYRSGLMDYKEFEKSYNSILTESMKTAGTVKKARIDAAKEMTMKGNRGVSAPGSSGSFSMQDMESGNLVFSNDVTPVTTIQETYTHSDKPGKPPVDNTEKYYKELYTEVQKRELEAAKNGETVVEGVPELALAYAEVVPGVPPSQARIVARQNLPTYQVLSKMFDDSVIPKGQLIQFISLAKSQGFSENDMAKALKQKYGVKPDTRSVKYDVKNGKVKTVQ